MLLRSVLLGALSGVYLVSAAMSIPCNSTAHCPEDSPCCSQYGYCGTGLNCLGGCNPHFSFHRDACLPEPICQNLTTDFSKINTEDIINTQEFLGDADDADWVYTGYIADYDDSIILAMPENSGGTVLSTSRFVWYGNVKATFKTSRDRGVVTAFILFSNSQDEIDFEFVGYDLTAVETNYYYQAVLNYTNGDNHTLSNTFENFHDYEVDWTPERIIWSVDGEELRTLKKEDTYNETDGTYYYPQTPSRVQLSIWPAGQDSNGVGTIEWAGGLVNWSSTDIQEYGYYYMFLKSVSIECYDPPAGTLVKGDVSYQYNSSEYFDQEYIVITNNDTTIGNQDATGLDPDRDSSDSSSSSSSRSGSSASGSSTKSSKSGSTGSATSTGSASGTDEETLTASPTATGFVQFAGSTSASTNGAINLESTSLISILFASFMFFV